MSENTRQLPEQGAILLVDKASAWTSHDIVAKSRRALGTRKVGHAGTLDPMATGLLVLGAGPATRLLTHLVGLDKCYTATIRLGIATVSDDREGERTDVAAPEAVSAVAQDPERVYAAVRALTGAIEQVPSAVSAVKIGGKRAYDLVREGVTPELRTRSVTIHEFSVGELRSAVTEDGVQVLECDARVRCSSGTYIRALARDVGASLGIGGHLISLRRESVGPFTVHDAMSTEQLAAGEVWRLLSPADVAAQLFPVWRIDAEQERDLGHGKRIEVDPSACGDTKLAAAITESGRLAGLVSIRHGKSRVVTNFPEPHAAGETGALRAKSAQGQTAGGVQSGGVL